VIVLDTNVLSEPLNPEPNQVVAAWVESVASERILKGN
jgi:predicted nucleic acid-binding protein